MDNVVLAAIITASGAVLTAVAVQIAPRVSSRVFRSRHHIPDILASWTCEWFVDNAVYSTDTIKITKWTRDNHFVGTGQDTHGIYEFSGDVNSSRVVVASYRDENYPNGARTGTFILNVSVDGKSMEGYWHGLTNEGGIHGGKVVCKRQ